MAIAIYTEKPHALLERIIGEVRSDIISGWNVDKDNDLFRTGSDLKGHAWLRGRPSLGVLWFGIVKTTDAGRMSKTVYAQYHADLAAMILEHFDEDCTTISLTAHYDHRLDVT